MSVRDETRVGRGADPATWVDRHGDALYGFALLRLRDPEAAEDAVQECFAAALEARERFSGRSSERTWLVGILKRKVVDQLRKTCRDRSTNELSEAELDTSRFFAEDGLWAGRFYNWGGDPETLAENREFWAAFRKCLDGLSSRLAEAFMLRELDRMESDEICEILAISPTNLWARLHRARLGLQQCLESTWFSAARKSGAR